LRLTADRAAGLALILIGALAIVESRALPFGSLKQPGPAMLPVVLGAALIAFGALLAAFGRTGPRLAEIGWEEARQALLILAGAATAAFFLERLGYVITMAALLAYLLAVVARRHILIAVPCALLLAGGTFLLFDLLLRVPLPRSPFATF
jgi:putative tricarboxylic transport membrane protein